MKFAEAGRRGPATYVEKTLTDGLRYKAETYRLTLGDEEGNCHAVDAFLIACANASQYGNNAYIAPHASMRDGLLDVTVLEPFNLIEAPIVAMQLFSKSLPKNSHVKCYRTNRTLGAGACSLRRRALQHRRHDRHSSPPAVVQRRGQREGPPPRSR